MTCRRVIKCWEYFSTHEIAPTLFKVVFVLWIVSGIGGIAPPLIWTIWRILSRH